MKKLFIVFSIVLSLFIGSASPAFAARADRVNQDDVNTEEASDEESEEEDGEESESDDEDDDDELEEPDVGALFEEIEENSQILGQELSSNTQLPREDGDVNNIFGIALSYIKWMAGVAGVAGFLLVAIQLMIGRRNRSAMAAASLGALPWIAGGLLLLGMSTAVAEWVIGIQDDNSLVQIDDLN